MGQQQLLLIVLGVIIVGIAVVVGINLFNANAEESAKDNVVSQCTNLGAMAQQYFKKPTSMGGGGNKFTGFTIPTKLQADSSIGADFTAEVTAGKVTIKGKPFSTSGYNFSVTTVVTDSSIISSVQ